MGFALLCITACSQNPLLSRPGGAIDPVLARPPFLNQPSIEGTSSPHPSDKTKPTDLPVE
jgi:hypothetical protein